MVSKEKMNKKERKEMEARQRRTWAVRPIMKVKESKKRYERKRRREDGEC